MTPALLPVHAPATRGRPVWTLVLLIAGWVLLRAATWQPAAPDHARKPQVPALVTHAPADGALVPAAMAGPMLAAMPGPMPELPADIRAGLSPEVADQVARELPRELAHQLAIETAREMAKAMAPGLAQRLLHERGLDRLVQARVQASVQASAQSGPALRVSGWHWTISPAGGDSALSPGASAGMRMSMPPRPGRFMSSTATTMCPFTPVRAELPGDGSGRLPWIIRCKTG